MSLALALDALESVKRHSHSSVLWQALARRVQALSGTDRQLLLDEMATFVLPPGPGEWLRCSAMAALTQDTAWYVRQAEQAGPNTLPDAIFSLMGLAWYHALARTTDRTTLRDCLLKINLVRLQQHVAGQLPERPAAVRRRLGERLRIAIYTPHIASPNHGGTLFSLNMLNVLREELAEVVTFSAQENHIPQVASYHGGSEHLHALDADLSSLQLQRPGTARFVIPDTALSLRARLLEIQQAIESFTPDLVLFVGFYSPMVFDLYQRYPVLGLSVHALPPIAPVDVWLSADIRTKAGIWPGIAQPQPFDFPFRFWPTAPFKPLTRDTLGLPDNATVLICVGYRLQDELSQQWQQRMLALLESHPDVHWLLLGVLEVVPDTALPQHSRIYRIKPQTSISPWLALSDIFINPPRVGGGGAVAQAMEQGLAVAAINNGDGGDKLGHYAATSENEYFTTLEHWLGQPDERRAVGQALQARFRQRLDLSGAHASSQLIQACHQTIEEFQQRNLRSTKVRG
ncbi:hypothetical protein NJC38_18780 [Pseudomonas sp. 21LCFQ010]|uniref:glycosyltransferase n=1 Tax=Pseudomonas sp. 21LCFQ010 TaxID=2957506 RepID=UPI00209842EF|nr:hypothetical protein [Pseudomonas sp. 21LCFQ010]MCO8164198.1 hypothetical protein [Pseudomonas sp. 21LCFQ010]